MNAAVLTIIVTLAAIPAAYAGLRLAACPLRARGNTSASIRAALMFARGISPTLGSILLAFGVVLPAFVLFEPPHEGERVGALLMLFAALGALHLLRVGIRVHRMLQLSRVVTTTWRHNARRLREGDWGMPTYLIDAAFPVVAVSGFLRPTLFIDSRVVAACSRPELAAIAAHERAHVRNWDNLRRLLIGSCAGPRSATASAWREAAEQAADDHAAASSSRAVDLASALLKMARIAPARSLELTALSTVHDGGDFETRIRRLLMPINRKPRRSPAGLVVAALVPLLAILAANWVSLLSSVHAVGEAAVRYLR
jgi:beta-lactamase regulating signal transducer with metallopeptidase domain